MGVATAIIAVGIAVTAALGPEKRGSRFETAAPAGADAEVMHKRPQDDIEAASDSTSDQRVDEKDIKADRA